jgi:hypothetical protein
MDSANKPERLPEGFDDESIDLSGGFVPKTPQAAGEPPLDELTPDRFMAQQAKPASVPDSFDSFMAAVAHDGSEAAPIEPKTEITWRWASPGDMHALRLLNAEMASAQTMYLPELPSDLRPIAAAAKGGNICGGLMSEDSVVVSLIGQDPAMIESAREVVIPILVAQARKERTRFLSLSLPKHLAATLDGVLQKVGFKPVDGIQ